MLNFFQSTINVEILILENGVIQVNNNGRTIYEGCKEECMNKIKRDVINLQGLGDKAVRIIVKSWSMYTSNAQLITDAISYFRNHIGLLKSSVNTDIDFSFRSGGGGGGVRSW